MKSGYLLLNANPLRLAKQSKKNSKNKNITIVNLHRVSDDKSSAYTPLRVELFEEFLRYIVKHYQIITFTDIISQNSNSKPKLILTFDDGYKDFIEIVVPLLRKYRISANQNIIPKSLISGVPPLNVLAQDFIGSAPVELLLSLQVPGHSGIKFKGNRTKFALNVSKAIKMQSMADQVLIEGPMLEQFYNYFEFKPTEMLTVSDINELKTSIEIGMHSYEHATMIFETDKYFLEDIDKCAKFSIKNFNFKPQIYAFPNGTHSESQINIAKSTKFSHFLMLGDDYSLDQNRFHPRFLLYGESLNELHYRLRPKRRFETFRGVS